MSALGGYITSAYAKVRGDHEASGEISDDVAGEVPDKAVKVPGSGHFGGFTTLKSVEMGNFKVTDPFCVSNSRGDHCPLSLGSKIVAMSHTE